MDIIERIKQDYQRFPLDQSYDLYSDDVYFKDPLTQFRGIKRYREMIDFMSQWLHEMKLDLHHISCSEDIILTEWTLSWTTPLPWRPRISIDGNSQLRLNSQDKIIAHIDTWKCSRWQVLWQHFSGIQKKQRSSHLKKN